MVQCGMRDARSVPEGRWKLAGGVSHRNRPSREPAPEGRRRGGGVDAVDRPLPSSAPAPAVVQVSVNVESARAVARNPAQFASRTAWALPATVAALSPLSTVIGM